MPMTVSDQYGNQMGITSNPESVNVMNGQPNAGAYPIAFTEVPKAPYQTLKTFTGVQATQAAAMVPVTLYTVTVGKTFYLTDIVVTNNSANACAASINNSVTAGVGAIATGHSINTSPFSMTNIGSEPSIAGGNPVVLQLGQSGTITTCAYTVLGYEQ